MCSHAAGMEHAVALLTRPNHHAHVCVCVRTCVCVCVRARMCGGYCLGGHSVGVTESASAAHKRMYTSLTCPTLESSCLLHYLKAQGDGDQVSNAGTTGHTHTCTSPNWQCLKWSLYDFHYHC